MKKPIKLNLGCGVYFVKGWINVDKYLDGAKMRKKGGPYKNAIIERGSKFVKADICNLPFKENYADIIECHQTIEHLPMRRIIDFCREVYRVLKPGGKCIISTNNMNDLCLGWLQMSLNRNFNYDVYIDQAEPIYGNQHAYSEGEYHRVPITPDFLNYCLSVAGFKNGVLTSYTRGATIPQVGELIQKTKKKILRNELLVAEVTKGE